MPLVDSRTTQKMIDAADRTATLVNESGLSPTDAVIKVARDMSLTSSMVPLLVRAYNTGRTAVQRNQSTDVFEKAADFDIADVDAAMATLFPSEEKQAADRRTSTVDAHTLDYASGPAVVHRFYARAKAAQATIPVTPPVVYQRDNSKDWGRARTAVSHSKTAAEQARQAYDVAATHWAMKIAALEEYFRQPTAIPFAMAKEAAVQLHAEPAITLFDYMATSRPGLLKLAQHRRTVAESEIDCTAAPFPLIHEIFVAAETAMQKQAVFQQRQQQYADVVEQQMRPLVGHRPCDSITGDREKVAFGFGGMELPDPLKALGTYSLVSRTMGPAVDAIKGPDSNDRIAKAVSSLTDPSHEQRLRAINAHAMLTEMMATDPVISKYDPAEVMQAYNHISQLTPSIADQTSLMQAALQRRLLQGSLDTHEQGQLLGFDQSLRNQLPRGSSQAMR